MSDDDHLRATIKFEDIDVAEETDAESDDLLDGLEETSQNVQEMTNPFRPAMRPEDTVKAEIPQDLLDRSRAAPGRGQRGATTRKVPTWLQFFVTVDDHGRIVLDARGAGFKPGDKVQVLVRPDEK